MRRPLFVAMICVLPQLALAECRDDALAARARITSSGSLHFDTTHWNGRTTRRTCGTVDPGRARHMRDCGADSRGHEEITIAKQTWRNDGLGWQGPYTADWFYRDQIPEAVSRDSFAESRCLGRVTLDRVAFDKYELLVRPGPLQFIETLFVDVKSGMTTRYDKDPQRPGWLSTRTTYRYDASITFAPPMVDPAARYATSMQRFRDAVAQSDPSCRRDMLAAIARGVATPFLYEIKGDFTSGISGESGAFAPPDSIHHFIEGAPFHGGETELIAIGSDLWIKRDAPFWRSLESDRGWADKMLERRAVPPAEQVGGVKCLGPAESDGQRYVTYEYDFYADTASARVRVGVRRISVDVATELPVRFEQTTDYGTQIETRRYRPRIILERPAIRPPAQ